MSERYGMFALPKQPLSPSRKARTRFSFQHLAKQGFDNSQNFEGAMPCRHLIYNYLKLLKIIFLQLKKNSLIISIYYIINNMT